MTYLKLDKEERKILKAFESGRLKPIPNIESEIARYRSYARASLEKKKINIELTKRDLLKLKEKAADKGISYQKLASSVLHQYGNQ